MTTKSILVLCILTLTACYVKYGDGKTANEANISPNTIIIDHTSVAEFERIPKEYLDKAKESTLHYIHTSHGRQILDGLESLEKSNPVYSIAVQHTSVPGLPPKETPPALRIYHSGTGPSSYWTTENGMDRTRNAAKMNIFNFSMFSWCGEMSSYKADRVQQYLANLDQLESEFKNMRFIYMTGHVDGGKFTLLRNNQMIRDYVKAHGKVLFDFADIESYDPDGHHYSFTGRYGGECSWCPEWCEDHPSDCADIPSKCAHSSESVPGGSPSMAYVCKLKAKAFWVMMARLAGWDGK